MVAWSRRCSCVACCLAWHALLWVPLCRQYSSKTRFLPVWLDLRIGMRAQSAVLAKLAGAHWEFRRQLGTTRGLLRQKAFHPCSAVTRTRGHDARGQGRGMGGRKLHDKRPAVQEARAAAEGRPQKRWHYLYKSAAPATTQRQTAIAAAASTLSG